MYSRLFCIEWHFHSSYVIELPYRDEFVVTCNTISVERGEL